MKELLEYIIKSLVSKPDLVQVEEIEDGAVMVLKVIASEDDYGKIIGKNGKVAQALRSIIRTANKEKDIRYLIKIGDK